MLSREAIQSARPLAEDMVRRGFAIYPVENSPLETLVKESIPALNTVITDTKPNEVGYTFDAVAYEIEESAGSFMPNTDIKPHDMAFDEMVPALAESVRNHVSFARGTVAPYVKDLLQAVEDALASLTPSTLLGMEVAVFDPPAPFTNSAFENSIGKLADAQYDASFILPFAMPELSLEQLDKLMETGSNALDKDIKDWLSTLSSGFVDTVYQQFFRRQMGDSLHKYISQPRQGNGFGSVDVDRLMVIYFLARGLLDTPPEGVDVNLNSYILGMTTLRNVTGARLYFESQSYYDAIGKQKRLIVNMTDKKIVVYGQLYKTWVEQGGQNEVLFGNLLSAHPVKELDLLMERREALLAEWNRHSAIVATTEANNRFTRIKQLLLSIFRKSVLAENDPQINKELLLKAFEQEVGKIGATEIDCLPNLVLKLVCRTRYAHTSAEFILTKLNQVAQENPKLDIREAATIATACYVNRFLANLMKVV